MRAPSAFLIADGITARQHRSRICPAAIDPALGASWPAASVEEPFSSWCCRCRRRGDGSGLSRTRQQRSQNPQSPQLRKKRASARPSIVDLALIDQELERISRAAGKNVLPGEVAFKLYDTYGFPLDLTEDVLRNHEFDVDSRRFNRLMEEQRRARTRRAQRRSWSRRKSASAQAPPSRFVGYHYL